MIYIIQKNIYINEFRNLEIKLRKLQNQYL